MTEQEVGRWTCGKCANTIVAAGRRMVSFMGIGAFMGPCPWGCGAWINRGFRWIKPGQVRAYRSDEWDQRKYPAVMLSQWEGGETWRQSSREARLR